MFPFRSRIIPSARLPLEIKPWVLEWLIISYKDISPASWCAMVNVGSFFRTAVSVHLVELAEVPCPMDHLQDRHMCSCSSESWKSFCMSWASLPKLSIRTATIEWGKSPKFIIHQGMIHTKMGRSTVTSSTIAAWHNNWIVYPCNC